MVDHLDDEGLHELNERAGSMTAAAFGDYLDEITGVKVARELDDPDGVAACVLAFKPAIYREHLISQDVGMLTHVLRVGDVMDRVLACLRLLRLRDSEIPSSCSPDVMPGAQRHLSELLVRYPVLMHNRIFVRGHHFAAAEFGPIATVIAQTPRAEFPRASHGIPVDRLRAFARHHCVRTGLTRVAPCPSGNKKLNMQAKTMLDSFGSHGGLPRPRMLTSVLELDEHRAHGLPTSKRPASFLTTSGSTERDLQKSMASSLLAAFNIRVLNSETCFDPSDFIRAIKSADINRHAWFLRQVEANLWRWIALPAEDVGPALTGLGKALREIRPYGIGPFDIEVQPSHLMRWFVSALLDSSSDRAVSIGISFKQFPYVDVDKAMAALEAVDAIGRAAGESPDLLPRLVEQALGQREGEAVEVWRAATRAYRMQATIDGAMERREVQNIAPAPMRRSRAL